jgi:NADPH2:quinone reductase
MKRLEAVDVVLETIGGGIFRRSLDLLAPFGRIVVAGFASLDLKRWNPISWIRTWRDIPRAGVEPMARRSIGMLASHLGYLLPDAQRLGAVWNDLAAFVRRHDIRPVIGKTFPRWDLPEAHRWIESRQSTGKAVVRIAE